MDYCINVCTGLPYIIYAEMLAGIVRIVNSARRDNKSSRKWPTCEEVSVVSNLRNNTMQGETSWRDNNLARSVKAGLNCIYADVNPMRANAVTPKLSGRLSGW